MSRIKLKQILSNIQYNPNTDQLTISGSGNPTLTVAGSVNIVPTNTISGSLTIQGYDTFGDSGSGDTIDLGSY